MQALETKEHTLPRVLSASQATAVVVGTIIGSGIFLVPQEMVRAVGSSSLVYLAWGRGGIAFAVWCDDVCGVRRDAALCRRRVCLPARGVRGTF